ncbi:MAG: GntR family transcriptional regulator [Fervidobacterium sp.]|nr:GntR family transcriptional regulator [Fervidobacterium sp.]
MWFSVDFNSHIPVYLQIKEHIKGKVINGELKPGEFIPSIRTLAKDIGVNLNTVARAYRELEIEGIIRVERGEGYVVANIENSKIKLELVEEFEKFVLKLKQVGVSKDQILRIVELLFDAQK